MSLEEVDAITPRGMRAILDHLPDPNSVDATLSDYEEKGHEGLIVRAREISQGLEFRVSSILMQLVGATKEDIMRLYSAHYKANHGKGARRSHLDFRGATWFEYGDNFSYRVELDSNKLSIDYSGREPYFIDALQSEAIRFGFLLTINVSRNIRG